MRSFEEQMELTSETHDHPRPCTILIKNKMLNMSIQLLYGSKSQVSCCPFLHNIHVEYRLSLTSSYCLTGERRRALFNSIKEACKELGVDGHIIEQDQIVDFIMGDTLKYQWTAQLLPRESNFMENTMLATHTLIPQ